jgi:NTE family protein
MTRPTSPRVPERLAIVLAGAGARGAYEAGVLAKVLPHLEQAGIRPHIYIGTSAGAINACLFAAHADLPASEQADAVLKVWRDIKVGDVFRPLLRTGIGTAARWTGQLLRFPGVRLTGLVDTAPLRVTADRVVPWGRLRANLNAEHPTALAVVATSARTGRSVVFVDRPTGGQGLPTDDLRPIDYVAARIEAQHVLASAAIPVLFPPAQVAAPQSAAGWYTDGGVRLNAPLKPALALGADALLIVATHPANYPIPAPPRPGGDQPPDVDDDVVQLLDAALVDPMVEDVRTLCKINQLVEGAARRRTPGGRTYEEVPFLFFGPQARGALAGEAVRAYQDRFSGFTGVLRGLQHPDLPLLARFVSGDGDRRGDLLSYLLFDSGFMNRAIDLGKNDATKALGGADGQVAWHTTTP